MEEKKGKTDLGAIKTAFFDAMVHGYADPNTKKAPVPGLPGSKSIMYQSGEFVVMDCYFVREGSNVSSGFTLITKDGIPVWVMHYGGWYEKEAIPFLKSALMAAYQEGEFFGGRGPVEFMDKKEVFIYKNAGSFGDSSFSDFRGSEKIFELHTGRTFGTHEYFGGLFTASPIQKEG